MATLKVGDAAPAFAGQTQDGEQISLADFAGRTVVLYFYPKDDTPGCTTEACGFRDHLSAFNDRDAVVIGVSPDSVASHKKFADKFELPFKLLADVDRKCIEAYGVWVEKKNYGKTYMGVQRATFIIGPKGKLVAIYPKVSPATHPEEVLAAID